MMIRRQTWGLLTSLRPDGGLPAHVALRCYSSAAGSLQSACLSDVRGVLRLSGTDLIPFLQGLLTNDVLPLEPSSAPPMYACLLNAQGRHLHDMLLFRTPDATPTVLLDVHREGIPDLLRLLRRYRLHRKIELEDVSEALRVWVRFGPGAAAAGGESEQGPWRPDPRLPALGMRAILPTGEDAAAASPPGAAAPWQAFRAWRVAQGVSEGDEEMPSGEAVPLEYNIEGLAGISFTKGCYVGQELMARTHFKGVVRKRLMPLQAVPVAEQGATAAAAAVLTPGAEVYGEEEGGGGPGGRPVGKLRAVDGAGSALGLLRLARALPAVAPGAAPLYVRGDEGGGGGGWVAVRPRRPEWWPASWGLEEGPS